MKSTKRFKDVLNGIASLSPECWAELGNELYHKEIEKEACFSRANSSTQEIGFVVSGIMRIYYLDENGIEWNKKFLIKDDFVMANVNPDEKSKVFIQAIEKTEMIGIQFQAFLNLSKKFPEMNLLTQKLMMKYLDLKQNREIGLLSLKAKDRYIQFLDEYADVKNEIPKYHIASYLGITPTQLSRLRKNIS